MLGGGGGGNGEEVTHITSKGTPKPSNLFSSHGEADTKMIFHAIDADIMFEKSHEKWQIIIIIRSADADMLVLTLYYYQHMYNTSQLWIQTGIVTATQDKRRYIPVHYMSESLGGVLCNILPEARALTGCDTASGIYGIGKKTHESHHQNPREL